MENKKTKPSTEIVKQIFSDASDSYVNEYLTEIKMIQENSKLVIWLMGFSIGLELFIIKELIPLYSVLSCFNKILVVASSSLFILTSVTALLTRIIQTRVTKIKHLIAEAYSHQKTQVLIYFETESSEYYTILRDYLDSSFTKKVHMLEYGESTTLLTNKKNNRKVNFLDKTESLVSILFAIQAVLSICSYVAYLIW